jgi:L-threonylcarbamoyladenylate synthase
MPKRLVVDPEAPDEQLIREAVARLAAGEIVAYPTDTLYGLAVDPRDARAVRRLYEAKGRPPALAIPLVAADLDQVLAHVGRLAPEARRLAERFWPGPLSLVIEARGRFAAGVLAPDGTVAVRVPAHAVARAIARTAGHPITATSANRSGAPPAATPDAVAAALGDRVGLIVDGGAAPGGPPSTMVRVVAGRVELVREGAVPWARVLEWLQ